MKHIKILLTFALFVFPVSGISLLAQFGGGDGIASNLYQISSKADVINNLRYADMQVITNKNNILTI
jgi:hypothetical protein